MNKLSMSMLYVLTAFSAVSGCSTSIQRAPEIDLVQNVPTSEVDAEQPSRNTYESEVISTVGYQVTYIEKLHPGSEGMSDQAIAWSKQFGTYDELQKSVSLETGKVWVGTIVTKGEDGKCTANTTFIASAPEVGAPRMQTEKVAIPCSEPALSQVGSNSNPADFGRFAGDELKPRTTITSSFYSDGGAAHFVTRLLYADGREKECVYEMTGQNATLVKSQFKPQSRICYPAHTFVRDRAGPYTHNS